MRSAFAFYVADNRNLQPNKLLLDSNNVCFKSILLNFASGATRLTGYTVHVRRVSINTFRIVLLSETRIQCVRRFWEIDETKLQTRGETRLLAARWSIRSYRKRLLFNCKCRNPQNIRCSSIREKYSNFPHVPCISSCPSPGFPAMSNGPIVLTCCTSASRFRMTCSENFCR